MAEAHTCGTSVSRSAVRRERAGARCASSKPSYRTARLIAEAPLPFAPTTRREDETSVQRSGSARLWSRNHLVDVVGEIAQSKSGSIPRPVPTCRNGRYLYRTPHDQRRSDGRSCLNFSRFHFSSLSSPLKPPFRDDDGARIAPSAHTPPKRLAQSRSRWRVDAASRSRAERYVVSP